MWYAPIIPRLKRLFRNKEHPWHRHLPLRGSSAHPWHIPGAIPASDSRRVGEGAPGRRFRYRRAGVGPFVALWGVDSWEPQARMVSPRDVAHHSDDSTVRPPQTTDGF